VVAAMAPPPPPYLTQIEKGRSALPPRSTSSMS
jgi:hypothetical protein